MHIALMSLRQLGPASCRVMNRANRGGGGVLSSSASKNLVIVIGLWSRSVRFSTGS